MKIILCGAGQIGATIALYLSPHYDIVLMDTEKEILSQLQERMDIQIIQGSASDPEALQRADIQAEDKFVAVTGNDEVNLTACALAKHLFSVSFSAARVHQKNYCDPKWMAKIKESLAIDVILSPERNAAEAILQSMHVPYAFDTHLVAKGTIQLVGIQLLSNSPILGYTVEQVYSRFSSIPLKLVRILRAYEILVPEPNHVLQSDDAVYFLAPTQHVPVLMQDFGYPQPSDSQIILFGASQIGTYVLDTLCQSENLKLTLIEEDIEKIKAIAPTYPNVLFMQGSALDPKMLTEAGILNTTHTLAVTTDDSLNVLASLLAHSYNVDHPISLLQQARYLSSLFALGIEKMIHPAQLVMASLMEYLNKPYMLSFYPLEGEQTGMLIEALVHPKAQVIALEMTAIESDTLQLPVLFRNGTPIWSPTEVQVGDSVCLILFPDGYAKFLHLFAME